MTIACAMSLSSVAYADPVEKLHKEQTATQSASVKSQQRVEAIFEQSFDLLTEYRQVVTQADSKRVYNDYFEKEVGKQQDKINSLQKQIDGIENTKVGVVPLMDKMITALEQFINLDIPIELEKRLDRVERIKRNMTNPDVTTSERFRQILDAYQIENNYGAAISPYQGKINDITVDMVHVGRIALLALSLDSKKAWVWDNNVRDWVQLGDEYLKPVNKVIRLAKKQVAPDLIEVPLFAAESAQ